MILVKKISYPMAIEHKKPTYYPNSQSQRLKFQRLIINFIGCSVISVLLVSLGCVRAPTTVPQASKDQVRPNQLIKPMRMPEGPDLQSWNRNAGTARPGNVDQGRLQNPQFATPPSVQVRISKPQGEDQLVRTAALALSRTMGPIQKIKLCYVSKDDEWWATFYQDIGSVIDLKQFIWNRESEKFEPFLVLKRIPKSKFAAELKREERGQTCSIIPLTEVKYTSQPGSLPTSY
jgi:hypothetical protein